jgi:4-amino-4-deoxy-L-arabinose transferase-like glycosyltransferase
VIPDPPRRASHLAAGENRPATFHSLPGRAAFNLPNTLTLLALLFLAVWLSHWPLLRLPYYWDEAGYYIPAAYDFFRRGTLIPYSTLSNAHPPLPSLYLAAFWRVFGFTPFVTRSAMCLVAAVALSAVHRLARLATADKRAAAAVTLLTALYPVWFVQSTLAHADLLAAAGTLWGLALLCHSDRNEHGHPILAAATCFALAALAKEIAIGTPLSLALWELWLSARSRTGDATPRRAHLRAALLLITPAVPLAAWFTYHRWRTGFIFGNPEYLRYNATSTLVPTRILLALVHRGLHLTAHLNLFVPVLVTLGCLLLPRLAGRVSMPRSLRARLLVVLVANWIFFSVLGGALLTRYLLPLYPLVLLLCVDAWRQRLQHWISLAALTAAAFLLGLFINPPYRFAPEDTLAYRDSILLQQDAIAQIRSRYGSPTVLTAWPASDNLTKPELGYVASPLPVVAIDNFALDQIRVASQKAAQEVTSRAGAGRTAPPYTVALIFSTKYDPSASLARFEGSLGQRNRALNDQYFGFHYDLPPEAIAHLLGGTVVWREQRNGQWAAVLHFDRPELAEATRPQPARTSLPKA